MSILSEMILVCEICESAFDISFQILEGGDEVWITRGGTGLATDNRSSRDHQGTLPRASSLAPVASARSETSTASLPT